MTALNSKVGPCEIMGLSPRSFFTAFPEERSNLEISIGANLVNLSRGEKVNIFKIYDDECNPMGIRTQRLSERILKAAEATQQEEEGIRMEGGALWDRTQSTDIIHHLLDRAGHPTQRHDISATVKEGKKGDLMAPIIKIPQAAEKALLDCYGSGTTVTWNNGRFSAYLTFQPQGARDDTTVLDADEDTLKKMQWLQPEEEPAEATAAAGSGSSPVGGQQEPG